MVAEQKKRGKARKSARPAADPAPVEGISAAVAQIGEGEISVSLPVHVREGVFTPHRLQVSFKTKRQKVAMRALYDGLEGRAKLANGSIVVSREDVLRWLAERIADAIGLP